MEKAVPDPCPAPIHDQKAGFHRRTVLGEGPYGKGHGGDHSAVPFQSPSQIGVGEGGERNDCRHPSAIGQDLERRDQMGLQIREGRVADHDIERSGVRKEVGQMTAVVPTARRIGKQAIQ